MDLFVAQPPVNHSLTLKPLNYKNNGSHATVIKRLLKVLQTRINAGFTKHFCLFKLNNVVPFPTIYSIFYYNSNTIFSSIITIIFFYQTFCGQIAVIHKIERYLRYTHTQL